MRVYTKPSKLKAFVVARTLLSLIFFPFKLKIIMSVVKKKQFSSWLSRQKVFKISQAGKSSQHSPDHSIFHVINSFILIRCVWRVYVFCCNIDHARRVIHFDRIRNLNCSFYQHQMGLWDYDKMGYIGIYSDSHNFFLLKNENVYDNQTYTLKTVETFLKLITFCKYLESCRLLGYQVCE